MIESPAKPPAKPLRCPDCRTLKVHPRVQALGLLERWVLHPMCLRPFRCVRCKNRFFGFSTSGVSAPKTKPASQPVSAREQFLESENSPGFDQLIDEIRQAEQRYGLSEEAGEK